MSWTIESFGSAPVDPAVIWRLYADPSTWPTWGHNARWARAEGPLVEGGTVDVKAGYGKVYRCRILRLVEGRALVLEARPPLIHVTQTYEVEPATEGAHVRHAIEIAGPLAGAMRLFRVHKVYQGWLDKEVAKLVDLAAHDRP